MPYCVLPAGAARNFDKITNLMRKKPQAYEPTPLQVRYRQTRAEAIACGQPFTDAALAATLACRAATISTWRRDPAFLEWLDADARAAVEHLWQPILLRAAQLALQGSVEHMRFLAQVRGEFRRDGDAVRDAQTPVSIIIGVPRPFQQA
jgi:hypothetical protein